MKHTLSWSVYDFQKKDDQQPFYFKFCLEDQTQKIQVYLCGRKPVTHQNFLRKLKLSLEENYSGQGRAILFDRLDKLTASETYQKFLKENYSLILEESSEAYTPSKKANFEEKFFNLSLDGKDVQNAIQGHSKAAGRGLKKYVDHWNQETLHQRQIAYSPRRVSSETTDKALKTELVRKTPFDITYNDQRELNDLSNRIENLISLVQETSENSQTQHLELRNLVENLREDIQKLFPKPKKKMIRKALRDPMTPILFELFLYNAGHTAVYQRKVKEAQLRIIYYFLY